MTTPSPFSPTLPTFTSAQLVDGIVVSARRLNRFVYWLEVDENGCWLYKGTKSHNGYGVFNLGGKYGKRMRAHRMAFQLWNGEILDDLKVLHKCDVPNCCCPSHLFLGTLRDNSQDMVAKGRASKKGGPRKQRTWTDDTAEVVVSMANQGDTISHIAREFGYDRGTIRNILKAMGMR